MKMHEPLPTKLHAKLKPDSVTFKVEGDHDDMNQRGSQNDFDFHDHKTYASYRYQP